MRVISVVRTVAIALTIAAPVIAQGQRKDSTQTDLERKAALARKGAGLKVGPWITTGLEKTSGADYSTMPNIEGYFRKGLDKHLALDNSVALWRRSATLTTTGGLGGGTSTEKVDAYVVPLFTALTLFPTTTSEDSFEPFVQGGAGFALGIEQRTGDGTGGLFDASNQPPAVIIGFGLRGATGAEWKFSSAFGASVSAGYQWVRFTDKVGGAVSYKGPMVTAGLTYRFQY